MSTQNNTDSINQGDWVLCEPIAEYCKKTVQSVNYLYSL